jgi:HlyD family secretion protein
LDKSNLISPRDLELAESQYLRAQAGLAAADAQLHAAPVDLDSAKANLAQRDIVSPIDGIVLDMDVVARQQVGPALLAPLFTIASDLARLDLEVGVDEADVPLVAVGDRVTFTVEATPDHELHGSVRQVRSGPKISEGVTSYVAVIAVDNADLVLKPGMTATASIITDEAKDVLSVANPALRFVPSDVEGDDAGVPGVYVLKDGVPTRIPVETGISDGQRTQLLSGPEAGELVITGIGGP